MPELPEVETVRLTLAPVIGRGVHTVWTSGFPLRLNRPVSRAALTRVCKGSKIVDVRRLGKYLLIDLEAGKHSVLVHLGMSGRLRLMEARSQRPAHTHVALALDGDLELRYSDARRFGMFELAPGPGKERDHPSLAKLGPDPLTDSISGAFLHQRSKRSRRTVKAFLLDQQVLAGVGNIYASEALWTARIHPARLSCELDEKAANVLARAVLSVLQNALSKGGTSLRDFVDADGAAGENADYLRVYGREGQKCPRRGCAGRIERTVIQGRATFHCPSCQVQA